LSGVFVLVVLLCAVTIVDALFFNGGFIVSAAYKANRGLFVIGVLFVALILFALVYRAARRQEVAPSDVAIQTVRGGNWAAQPALAFLMLFVTAAIVLGHTLPKYAHRFIESGRNDTVPFLIADAPGPLKRGCHSARATSPDFGDVTLCLPERVASVATGGTVFVSGQRSRYGLTPRDYDLTADAAPQASGIETAPDTPSAEESVFDINRILEELGIDQPEPEDASPPPTMPQRGTKNR
jgi:hypothetical protein